MSKKLSTYFVIHLYYGNICISMSLICAMRRTMQGVAILAYHHSGLSQSHDFFTKHLAPVPCKSMLVPLQCYISRLIEKKIRQEYNCTIFHLTPGIKLLSTSLHYYAVAHRENWRKLKEKIYISAYPSMHRQPHKNCFIYSQCVDHLLFTLAERLNEN